MLLCMLVGFVIFMVTLIMMLASSTLSKKTLMDREKTSPFECGFDPKSSSRLPFSLQFFLIAVIFLIFDVEITLLIPLIPVVPLTKFMNIIIIMTIYILILLAGLLHEWKQGSLNWAI
uniref:NADH-ubiquinone oxidoreductase chain 3 n=2 Tax=Lucanus TaxID=41108 RepID=A0A650BXS3_LUCCE|nr:NADH dehydrogenase subunit 3 [Lucanus cervus]APO08639.1 NADH dehydrogenase subunit 3 [Lucanus sp. BMNH 1425267]QDW75836.1 NADH dehydrogenase subunit 3 [Lucanus cervus]QGQ62203.1 NADH dehydrogenase subunit 3 [Lucanus cervus]UIN24724.1 NADH dehydrogenase subunit 3 [Lucanus cervus]